MAAAWENINNKHKMTIAAFEKFTDKLYDNLSLLTNHCDNFRKKYKLCKEGENSTHKNQSNEMKNKENITKMETRRSALRSNTVSGIDVSNTNKGIVLTIDKSASLGLNNYERKRSRKLQSEVVQ